MKPTCLQSVIATISSKFAPTEPKEGSEVEGTWYNGKHGHENRKSD